MWPTLELNCMAFWKALLTIVERWKISLTYDLEGTVTAEHEVHTTPEQLLEVLRSFEGEQMQTPPMVSAVKVGGKKLYERARKGVEVEREPRPIFIRSIRVSRMAIPECDFTLECSKGTYVRTLCHDVGRKLGCGGVLAALRRIRCGRFELKDAVTVELLKTLEVEDFKALLAEKLSLFAGFGAARGETPGGTEGTR